MWRPKHDIGGTNRKRCPQTGTNPHNLARTRAAYQLLVRSDQIVRSTPRGHRRYHRPPSHRYHRSRTASRQFLREPVGLRALDTCDASAQLPARTGCIADASLPASPPLLARTAQNKSVDWGRRSGNGVMSAGRIGERPRRSLVWSMPLTQQRGRGHRQSRLLPRNDGCRETAKRCATEGHSPASMADGSPERPTPSAFRQASLRVQHDRKSRLVATRRPTTRYARRR